MRWFLLAVVVLGTLALSACANVGYLYQAAVGHLEIIEKAEPIDEVLARKDVAAKLSKQLVFVKQIRQFSIDVLMLPDNGSYRRYADLGREAVVWNVVAAPSDSLEPKKWCYPMFGCVSYKGFYKEEDAIELAKQIGEEGYDVFVTGIPAYSTLGYTSDPVLNTFIFYPPGNLAGMIFHELAHQVVYIDNDTMFNESFATAVEELGARAWLATLLDETYLANYSVFEKRRFQFRDLMASTRLDMQAIFDDPARSRQQKLDEKALRFGRLLQEYESIKRDQWDGWAGYDRYMYSDMNNAKLALVGMYSALVPGFKALFEMCGADYPRFYAAVAELGMKEEQERLSILMGLASDDVQVQQLVSALCHTTVKQ